MRIVFRAAACWSIACIITFPQTGSADTKYYLTKSGGGGGGGGYSRESRGLIPFPRTGRSHNTWLVPINEDESEMEATPTSLSTAVGDELTPASSQQPDMTAQPPASAAGKAISKRSIPDAAAFNRRLLRSSADPMQSFYRRLTRSGGGGSQAFSRRLLRSDATFARRLLRSQDAFNRRLMRRSDPASSSFYRRLLRSTTPADAFKRRIFKKASLIPFPRTGKRSMTPPMMMEAGEPEESEPVLQAMQDLQPDFDTDAGVLMELHGDDFEPLEDEE